MDRKGKAVESGRSARLSMLLPAVVLVATLGLGIAASLRFTSPPEVPSPGTPETSAAIEVVPPPAVEPMSDRSAPAAVPAVAAAPVVPAPVVVVPEVVVPEGRAGLVEALRRGELRPGSRADVERWIAAARSSGQSIDPERLFGAAMDVFVIEGDFRVPGQLSGAHAVIFVLEAGKPFPRGDLGHSLVLDVSSGSCVGLTCRMMLSP